MRREHPGVRKCALYPRTASAGTLRHDHDAGTEASIAGARPAAGSWYLYGPDNRLQYDIAGTLGNGAWGYIVGTYDKDAGTNNQRLYLNGTRVAQRSGTLPIDLNSAAPCIGRHVSSIADPFNGHIDALRIAHVQCSDGWIENHLEQT